MDTNKKGNEMKVKYYRIKLWNEKRRFFFRPLSEDSNRLFGRRINKEGQDFSYINKDGAIVDKLDLIYREAIVEIEEWKMNKHYCELESI